MEIIVYNIQKMIMIVPKINVSIFKYIKPKQIRYVNDITILYKLLLVSVASLYG